MENETIEVYSGGTRSAQTLDPSIDEQKVSSTANLYVSQENKKISLDLGLPEQLDSVPFDFSQTKNDLNMNVVQQGKPTYAHDGFSGANYSCWLGYHPNGHQFMSATRTGV
jgi:hypothetical protein